MPKQFTVEVVEISKLKPHPRNYQRHPPEEIAHLKTSITENGVYRNVVVAKDYTLLAGHGVIQAMTELGRTDAPVHRLDLEPDDPRAIKVLVADNEIAHLSEPDKELLAELLGEIQSGNTTGLSGTGYTSAQLDALLEKIKQDTPEPPAEFPEYDGLMVTEHECPKCGYKWSGMSTSTRKTVLEAQS